MGIEFTPGTRLIWVVNSSTPFYAGLHRTIPLQPVSGSNNIYSTDLQGHGEAQIGGSVVSW